MKISVLFHSDFPSVTIPLKSDDINEATLSGESG